MVNCTLRSCSVCLVILAILLGLSVNNISLFLAATDLVWNILNYLDNSQLQYDGNVFIHTKPYAPVRKEVIDYNLKVIGTIPPELDGVMFKIGPNPTRKNIAIKYHWFDGDGMIHSVRFISSNNTAHYTNSFLHTTRYNIENKILNRSVYFHFFGSTHSNGIIGLFKLFFGRFVMRNEYFSPISMHKYNKHAATPYKHGTSNTNILHWNNKLFALVESDLPFQFKYNVQTCAIQSVGYFNFNNSWTIPFTAHPKVDRNTNQLFTHAAYIHPNFDKIVVGMTSSSNKDTLISSSAFQLNAGQVIHDMMITKKYILIFDLNIWFGKDVMKATKGKKIMAFNKTHSSRIGVMVRQQLEKQKRNAQIRWFDIKPCFVFHFVNAYDKDDTDEIVIIGNRFSEFDMNLFQFSTYNLTASKEAIHKPSMYEWKLNMRTNTGKVEERVLNMNIDQNHMLFFPMINPFYLGKKNCFMWSILGYFSDEGIVFDGFIKYDFDEERVVNTIMFNEHDVGNSEFVVIGKKNGQDEDDIFIPGFIYNRDTDKSRVEIYDGKSMDIKSIATIKLLRRVPIGFHSQFLSQNDLNIMNK